MNATPSPKLHIGNAIVGAFWIVWRQRLTFARALTVPMVFVVTLMMVWHETYESLPKEFNWLVWCGYTFLFVLIAVKCHRIVLLSQYVDSAWTLPAWSWRESRFVGWGLIAWAAAVLVYMLAMIVITAVVGAITGATESTESGSSKYLQYAGSVIYWHIFARLCLVFPAIAIDEKTNLHQAWQRSRGNGWRLFAVVCVLPYCISAATSYLYRNDATLIEYLLLTTLGTVLLAVEIAALSLSYQQLVIVETRNDGTA